jgi:glycerol-3-phosphate dehydrogenase
VTPLDLVVVGGGIVGLGVARLAARNGMSVAVLERGDLASGTSSQSSHMLHGGLRYLEHGQFALVRESLKERAAVGRMAPDLAHPCRFLVPVYRGGRLGPWRLRAGLKLYDWLAGSRGLAPYGFVGARAARALEPALEPEGLRGAGLYSDVVMDDAALAVAVARDAAAQGARIHTRIDVTGAKPLEAGAVQIEARDLASGAMLEFPARVVVNATGPWCDETRRRLLSGLRPGNPDAAPLLRPSRGAHLVYPALTQRHALLLTARSDARVIFVIPFGGHSLVGTTEVEVPTPPPPSAFRPSLEELRYLRRELAAALPPAAEYRAIAAFAGVRPLLRTDTAVGSASREHRVIEEHGLVTVAGGKYTTFRVMAQDVLAHVARRIARRQPIRDSDDPLPAPVAAGAGLETVTRHAVEHGFARTLADVVRRRTLQWLEPDRGRIVARFMAGIMGRELGWSARRTSEEIERYDAVVREEETLLARVWEEA